MQRHAGQVHTRPRPQSGVPPRTTDGPATLAASPSELQTARRQLRPLTAPPGPRPPPGQRTPRRRRAPRSAREHRLVSPYRQLGLGSVAAREASKVPSNGSPGASSGVAGLWGDTNKPHLYDMQNYRYRLLSSVLSRNRFGLTPQQEQPSPFELVSPRPPETVSSSHLSRSMRLRKIYLNSSNTLS